MLCVFIISSCQPEVDFTDTPPRIEEVDSTKLVKSVKLTYHTSESIIENYHYDTANHKILVTWVAPGDPDYDGMSAVFSYNDKNLLSEVSYSYSAGYNIGPGNYSKVSISYDNENVVEKVLQDFVLLPDEQINFTKTVLSSGYTLEWEFRYDDFFDPNVYGARFKAWFNSAGTCIKHHGTGLFKEGSNPVYWTRYASDSLIYTPAGDLQKVYTTYRDSAHHVTNEFLAYEFLSRETKGDQLSNHWKMLMNGLDNICVRESNPWFWMSVLGDNPDTYQNNQFTGFPFKEVKIYNPDTQSLVPFTASSTFDALGRLKEFKGVFNDTQLLDQIYTLTYYK